MQHGTGVKNDVYMLEKIIFENILKRSEQRHVVDRFFVFLQTCGKYFNKGFLEKIRKKKEQEQMEPEYVLQERPSLTRTMKIPLLAAGLLKTLLDY